MNGTNGRRKLSDILNGGVASLQDTWSKTEAADDFDALPRGEYIARIISGELRKSSKKGTPGYLLTFRVLEGEYTGRQFWHDLWLTAAALPMTKRDLAKLEITAIEQLEQPIPQGIRCKVKLGLRKDDDGNQNNRVRAFEVIGIDADPTADPDFAPPAEVLK
jgi:hypothetical protein